MKPQKNQTLIRWLLVLAAVILVNVISIRLFTRLDLTSQGVYTLSEASKNLVGSLDDRLTVKAYFTEDLPAPYNSNRRATLDILNDYKAYSDGNLHFEFVNPEGEKGEREAQEQGVAPVQVQVINNDKLEVKRGYMGLIMLYEDRKEALPVIQNLGSLEYDLSSAIKRLTTKVKKKIGYSTGHQEAEPSTYKQASDALQTQYELVPVDLSGDTPVPSDIAALLIISPQSQFSDSSKFLIDQYLMRGGKVAFLLNRYTATLQSRFAQELNTGLDDLLTQYGAKINADLVKDAQCAPVTVMQQQGMFQIRSQVPFPLLPNASNFSESNVIVKDLESVFFYFVSSIDTSLAVTKGLQTDVLVRSSQKSGRQTGFIMIDPMQGQSAADLNEQGIPLAVVNSGSFKSFYSDKQPQATLTESPDTRILVVGDGDFMKDDYLGGRDNLNFFQNIVDYLADDAGLISIRSKNIALTPLEQVSDGTRRSLKYTNLLLPPLIIAGYGFLRWRRRVSLKKALEAQSI